MKRTIFVYLTLLIAFTACSGKDAQPLSRTEFLLGTVCTVRIYDVKRQQILDRVFEEIKAIEEKISVNIPGSEISKINSNAGISEVEASEEVFGLVKRALDFSALSGGVFNVAIGPLVKLWGIGTDDARLPSEEEISEVLPLLDYMNVEVNEENRTVYLKEKGMALDLGGIAKGYIADRVKALLMEEGVGSALINLGGNVYALGKRPDGEKWKIGIQDPFEGRSEYYAIYRAENDTVVSSGVYERYFIKDGIRYHHIFDYLTGYPAVTGIVSATVIGEVSETADALSTIIFSLGISKGLSFISGFPGYKAVFVDSEMRVTATHELEGLFELTETDYDAIEYE